VEKEIRILILGDVPARAVLMEFELRRAEIPFISKTVKTRDDFVRELHDFTPDVILSDYYLPALAGSEALNIAQEKAPHVPFILVTGELSEEDSVELLKKGAAYVLQDNLSKLPSVLLRALR